jgi:hypothetical protein
MKSIKHLLQPFFLLTNEFYISDLGKTYRKAWAVQNTHARGIVAVIIDEDEDNDIFAFVYSKRMRLK